jgi:hypothetical protein
LQASLLLLASIILLAEFLLSLLLLLVTLLLTSLLLLASSFYYNRLCCCYLVVSVGGAFFPFVASMSVVAGIPYVVHAAAAVAYLLAVTEPYSFCQPSCWWVPAIPLFWLRLGAVGIPVITGFLDVAGVPFCDRHAASLLYVKMLSVLKRLK